MEYVYTPGWFSEARVGQMTLTWHDPAGVDGVDSWEIPAGTMWRS